MLFIVVVLEGVRKFYSIELDDFSFLVLRTSSRVIFHLVESIKIVYQGTSFPISLS